MPTSIIVKNKKEIATMELRKKALDIIEFGINKVLPDRLIKSALNYDSGNKILKVKNDSYDISSARIFVIGGGKAAGLTAESLENILGLENIEAGVIVSKTADYKTKKIRIIKGSHPIPDSKNIKGVKEILSFKDKYSINKNDIVISLISGGGSALITCPQEGISLKDLQKITELLISSGAEIQEINVVRKHLSKIKGGRLAKFFEPATVVSLIISDVVGDDLSAVASGPTYPDSSTFSDAYKILEKYDLLSQKPALPKKIVKFLKEGIEGKKEETPKKLKKCHNYLIGNNKIALEAMAEKSKEMGLSPFIVTSKQKGDPEKVARQRAEEILKGKYSDYDVLLLGGETNPKLPENYGRGGRNQQFAASSLLAMEKYKKEWVLVCLASDGSDFLEEVAGAIVDNNSLNELKAKNIDIKKYLKNFDSNTLLKKIRNSLVITGHTGTNVSDIMVYLINP